MVKYGDELSVEDKGVALLDEIASRMAMPLKIDTVKASHVVLNLITAHRPKTDAWDGRKVCKGCHRIWPCDTAVAIAKGFGADISGKKANPVTLEHSTVRLVDVHDPSLCEGRPCTIHNRSVHHLRSWPQNWRVDRGIMERISPFGGSCPDPDEFPHWRELSSKFWETVHGCSPNPYTGGMGCAPWGVAEQPAAWLYGYPGIAVTQDGRVWSFLDENGNADYTKHPGEVRANEGDPGHYSLRLENSENKDGFIPTHILVLNAFKGECPDGYVPSHLDNDPTNNSLDNLDYVPTAS